MLGSEVGNYLRLFRGDLYKKFPSLWRRKMTPEERRRASEQIGYGYSTISSNVQMVKASEVEDIIAGSDERYRSTLGFESSLSSCSVQHTSSASRSAKKSSWISQIPNSSFHLDAVPCATPVGRFKTNAKRVKSFPTW